MQDHPQAMPSPFEEADGFPLAASATGTVRASPERLFAHLDDPRKLSSHMEGRSMAMMGSAMVISTDGGGGRSVGSVIRMDGRAMGLRLSLEEVVTQRVPPALKTWATMGEPRLFVIGAYRMGFRIEPAQDGSRLSVFIAYALPKAPLGKALGVLLGPWYARWCCRRMLADARRQFGSPQGE